MTKDAIIEKVSHEILLLEAAHNHLKCITSDIERVLRESYDIQEFSIELGSRFGVTFHARDKSGTFCHGPEVASGSKEGALRQFLGELPDRKTQAAIMRDRAQRMLAEADKMEATS